MNRRRAIMKKDLLWNERQRFSIRKYSFGAASVLLGASLVLGGQVLADEQTAAPTSQPQDTSVQTTTGKETEAITPKTDGAVREAVAETATTDKVTQVTAENPTAVSDAEISTDKISTKESDIDNTTVPTKVDAAIQTGDYTAPSEINSADQAQQIGSVTNSSPVTAIQEVGKDLPNSGNYTYPERTEVKNSPSASAPIAFYANAGDRVYYDQVLNQDGYQWLSYKSYSGIRRYANIAKLVVKEVQADKPDSQVGKKPETDSEETPLPALERYIFDKEVEVKNEARAAAQTEFTFGEGDSISYDKILEADGYKWISYVSYGGTRRYVMLDKLPAQANEQKTESKLTGQISIENQNDKGFDVRISNVSDSNGILAVKVPIWTDKDDQDDIVWYDAVSQGDGTYKVAVNISDHKNESGLYNIHLYYIENDGAMKGVASLQYPLLEAEKTQVTRTGTLSFNNKDNGDFDVIISDVVDSQGVLAVKVPVWTDNDGQDDIVWYDATKQANGDYKVSVKVSDHKSQHGVYNVHLYYVENDNKLVGIAGTQTTVPEPAVKSDYETTFPSLKSYTFVKQVDVRNEPRMAADTAFTFQAGESINYDKIMHKDGHDWISYVSYGGQRRYIVIG